MPDPVRILIIDDDFSVREMLREFLELVGYEVLEASDGAIGVDLYRRAPTDLIITDMLMPHKDGLATIQDIRREFPHAKIIAMSGAGGDGPSDLLTEAHKRGAWCTIVKPFRLHEMLAAIQAIVPTPAVGRAT